MTGAIDARLAELGIDLPEAPAPAANYVPWVVTGNLVFIAGQVPYRDGRLSHVGKLGNAFTVEEGQACARIVAINVLAQLKAACGGDLDRVTRCVKLGGFVNATPDFTDQPRVINGASDLIVDVSAIAASMRASPSAPPRCRSTPPSRSTRCSRSGEAAAVRPAVQRVHSRGKISASIGPPSTRCGAS